MVVQERWSLTQWPVVIIDVVGAVLNTVQHHSTALRGPKLSIAQFIVLKSRKKNFPLAYFPYESNCIFSWRETVSIEGVYVRSWDSVTSQSSFFKEEGLSTQPVWGKCM